MRRAIYVAAACACALAAPELARTLLAGTASVLFEAIPYLLLSGALARVTRIRRLAPFAGCGCEPGPGARSIPAALALAALFGPWIPLARVAAATAAAHSVDRDRPSPVHDESIIDALLSLLPSALVASAVLAAQPILHLRAATPIVQVLAGGLLGFTGAPCALGAAAIAGALRSSSPDAAYGFLAIAGIVDLRTWWRPHRHGLRAGAWSYAILACACAATAYEGGATLVHPRIALALGACALVLLWLAFSHRKRPHDGGVWVGSALFAAVVIGAPQPIYTATQSTLSDAFANERITFTGMLVRSGSSAALVRYAITCCRADAQPVALALEAIPSLAAHTWVRAEGRLIERNDELVLRVRSLQSISPPTDPFIYR